MRLVQDSFVLFLQLKDEKKKKSINESYGKAYILVT